ncbi:MAG: DUF4956 domain-containing protein [Clostridia bacterium]|nr:DUF4956 domain-containing protein [Clostridia bacterium]
MLENILKGIFDSASVTVIPASQFLLCVGVALVIGGLIALAASRRTGYTQSFLVSLFALPALSCVVIMMVNGNVGAGVATAGAFSLVRFRSAAGSAKEIAMIFLAMVAGLIAGMGYLAYAVLFTLILCAAFLIWNGFDPAARGLEKELRITVPEDLNYEGEFDAILNKYCAKWKLEQVKTINMGSMFRLRYAVTVRKDAGTKEMIDELRCHNGNLEISLCRAAGAASDL